jgi:hypothetical protein
MTQQAGMLLFIMVVRRHLHSVSRQQLASVAAAGVVLLLSL